jgi:hypothetical protein
LNYFSAIFLKKNENKFSATKEQKKGIYNR